MAPASFTTPSITACREWKSLRAVLKHANQYGLKYVFVRDRYYEPLLAFAGWRKAETYDNGNVTLWTKEDVPPAKRLEFVGFRPTRDARTDVGNSAGGQQPVRAVPGIAGAGAPARRRHLGISQPSDS